jgi:hypothetical protein
LFDTEIPSYVRLNVLRKKLDYKLAQKRALHKKFIDRLIAVHDLFEEVMQCETNIMYKNAAMLFVRMPLGEIQIKEKPHADRFHEITDYNTLIGIIHLTPPVIIPHASEEGDIKYGYNEMMSKLDAVYFEICQVEATYIKTLEEYISGGVL